MMPSGHIQIAAVMGHPIAHSRSPFLHKFWLKEYGLNGSFVALDVTPENLQKELRALPSKAFRGTCVTIPHKETTAQIVDELDESAHAIGAVNLVTVLPDGRLRGQNTDGYGFIENIRGHGTWEQSRKHAIVFGAGGAARAVVYALAQEKFEAITILNRTRAKTEALTASIQPAVKAKLQVADWAARNDVLKDADVLVNTTSLGMDGHPPLEISIEQLPSSALVTDIVYTPLATPLLKAAMDRGNPTQDGLGMLMHQARPAFKAFYGQDPDVTPALRQALVDDIQKTHT